MMIIPITRKIYYHITKLFVLVFFTSYSFALSPSTILSSQSVLTLHGQIEYYCLGNGSPIILIPGYLTDISSWDYSFLAALATQHTLIIMNNRNVGRSWNPSSYYEMRDLANDVSEVIQQLDLKKPAILGISMGGMIAQQVAIDHPQQVGKLILINTAVAGKNFIQPSPAIASQIFYMPHDKLRRYFLAIQLFFPFESRLAMSYALAFNRFLPSDYVEINPMLVQYQQQLSLLHWMQDEKAAEKIAHLNLPVLILSGDSDAVIPPINSDILQHTIRHSKLIRFRAGGHAMIYQYPGWVAKAINDFLATHT